MSEPDTADLALREQIARVIAAELACQDGEDVAPEAAFGTSAELTWSYIDQGCVDFGQIADAILASLPAQGGERAEVTWVNDASRGGVMSANYDELVGRLEAQTIVSKDGDLYRENRNPDGPEAAAAIRALEGENFTLAAGQCLFDDGTGLTGDEGGTPYCAMKAARQSAEAKLEAVRGALIAIAHTFTEDGGGNMKTLPAHEYQAMAKRALASLDKEKAGG